LPFHEQGDARTSVIGAQKSFPSWAILFLVGDGLRVVNASTAETRFSASGFQLTIMLAISTGRRPVLAAGEGLQGDLATEFLEVFLS